MNENSLAVQLHLLQRKQPLYTLFAHNIQLQTMQHNLQKVNLSIFLRSVKKCINGYELPFGGFLLFPTNISDWPDLVYQTNNRPGYSTHIKEVKLNSHKKRTKPTFQNNKLEGSHCLENECLCMRPCSKRILMVYIP